MQVTIVPDTAHVATRGPVGALVAGSGVLVASRLGRRDVAKCPGRWRRHGGPLARNAPRVTPPNICLPAHVAGHPGNPARQGISGVFPTIPPLGH